MSNALASFRLVGRIALQSALANRRKTLLVAAIIAFATLLVVVGGSLLAGMDRAIRGSVTGSYAGHIQVYSSQSKESLEVMGRLSSGAQDLEPLADFAAVHALLSSLPNVAAVVPMGTSNALVSSGNSLDQALERLRATHAQLRKGDSALERRYATERDHVRQIVATLGQGYEQNARIADAERSQEALALVRRAMAPEFWSAFDADPDAAIEFLENRVSPIVSDADMLVLRYLGTDPALFARAFDRMHIVDGAAIPEGQRGFLFSKYTYEDQVKLKAARGLDRIREERSQRGARIAADAELQSLVRDNRAALAELLLQLDAAKSALFRAKLQAFLHTTDADLSQLLDALFQTTDENFEERYAFFYRELAPALELYRVRIGDSLTIKAVTRSGYVRSINVKVFGTFAFDGLEESPLAGELNLMDLVSFRQLYGFLSPEGRAEVEALRAASGVRDVARERVEDELFGEKAQVADLAPARAFDPNGRLPLRAAAQDVYDPAQLRQGVILNAAVLVRDEARIDETMREIERAGKRAGLPLKAVSWQRAAGVLGQLATLMQGLLAAAVGIIALVSLVILNNALVMATLERVSEIGTLRAIGAQRPLILGMLLLESCAVSLLAGAAGAALGGLVIAALSVIGLPAGNQVMTFFFSGPRLHPQLAGAPLAIGALLVFAMSIGSSMYPAWLALRVSPLQAMQREE